MVEHGGVDVARASPRSLAGIGVYGDGDGFRACMRAEFGVAVPTTPRCVREDSMTVSCLAPARYLASADPHADLVGRLAKHLRGLAAITDQSDMWHVFTLTGSLTTELLARLLPIDLAPLKFRVGDVALTRAGHLDVRVWRVAELGYELAATRSYAADLYALLNTHARVLGQP